MPAALLPPCADSAVHLRVLSRTFSPLAFKCTTLALQSSGSAAPLVGKYKIRFSRGYNARAVLRWSGAAPVGIHQLFVMNKAGRVISAQRWHHAGAQVDAASVVGAVELPAHFVGCFLKCWDKGGTVMLVFADTPAAIPNPRVEHNLLAILPPAGILITVTPPPCLLDQSAVDIMHGCLFAEHPCEGRAMRAESECSDSEDSLFGTAPDSSEEALHELSFLDLDDAEDNDNVHDEGEWVR